LYSQQPFDVTVTAVNLAGGTTKNYSQQPAALSKAITLSGYDAASGTQKSTDGQR